MTTPKKRPAHRPSRRTQVVEAAMQLFGSSSGDAVTVAEIAQAAGMTSAAVYYHFPSKDDILLEGLRAVGESLLDRTQELADDVAAGDLELSQLPAELLLWFEDRRAEATVWFVTSSGISLAVEHLRRALRGELLQVLVRAARDAQPGLSAAEAAVRGTALLALVETAASAWLTDDESLTGLGRKRFLAETRSLADRILA